MYRRIADFLEDWSNERASTLKLMGSLTDASLHQKVSPEGRSLGRLAWHITTTLGEMLGHAGMPVPGAVADDSPVPTAAEEIRSQYGKDAASLEDALRANWTDAMLDETIPMYGEQWKRGFLLSALVRHQAHHRGQMTVLMRQAGLPVAGVYGPAREEWAAMGMPAMD